MTTIGQSAFQDTTGLTTIDLTNTQVNNIGQSAFQNSGITSITLPKLTNETQFTTLGQGAFQGSQITTADFRNANLSTINTSLFQDCTNLVSVIVKKPDMTAVGKPNNQITPVQKQITSIKGFAFKNAINLQGIMFADENTPEADLVPNQVIKASPFLQSIESYAFMNVPKIKVFDASEAIAPNNKAGFIAQGLFVQDINLTDADGNAIQSALQAVILPSAIDKATTPDATTNYFGIGDYAFANNPNLVAVGTKEKLGWQEAAAPGAKATNLSAEEYLSKISKKGFMPSKLINVLGRHAFRWASLETVDFTGVSGYGDNGGFGSSATNKDAYGYMTFADNAKLTKVILPNYVQKIPNSMFGNTPNLTSVNFENLVQLNYIGTDNFNDLSKLTLSETAPNRTKRSTPRAATTLDLSNTKLTTLANNTFGNLPSGITEVKLPTTIDASFATNATTLTVKGTGTDASPTKIDLKKVKFTNANGTDGNFDTFQKLMTTGTQEAPSTATNGSAPQLFKAATLDLSGFSTLKTISPNTFNLGKDVLTSLQLPASATTWQIVASGNATNVNSQYDTAAFNNANKLTEISFNGFKENSQDGNLNIEDLSNANWDNTIKNANNLWSTIATVMNSLGYDPTLEKPTDANQEWSPNIGVQGKWEVPAAGGAGAQSRQAGGLILDKDLTAESLIGDTTTLKTWWSNKDNIGDTSKEMKDPTTKPTTTESMYFKHNGIIWNWTVTKDSTDSNNPKYYITLAPEQETLPNVYKAQSNAAVENGNDPNYYITTFKTQPVDASNAKAPSSYGVSIKLNIAIKKPAASQAN